jgi:ABC-2 type transport system ATP-binding protein
MGGTDVRGLHMENIIQTTNLTKFYGKNRGIKDVNITVRKGDIFGFLGPNGAGKSTTIRMLLDFIRPTGGNAMIFGLDCQKDSLAIRRRTGYVPAEANLYGHMTGWKYLAYLGGIRGRYDVAAAVCRALRYPADRKMRNTPAACARRSLSSRRSNDPDPSS